MADTSTKPADTAPETSTTNEETTAPAQSASSAPAEEAAGGNTTAAPAATTEAEPATSTPTAAKADSPNPTATSSANAGTTVLVTGGSGFIGGHCLLVLLNAGYKVRTTVRSLKSEAKVRKSLEENGAKDLSSLSFVEADLLKDDGWDAAVEGCPYVWHVASPFPSSNPRNENELIKPAKEGSLRVLKAAKKAGVKRVVLTSSFAAIGYGIPYTAGKVYDETSWSNPNSPEIAAYPKSKTVAEKAAWDYIEKQEVEEGKPRLELTTVNPVAVMGPMMGSEQATSFIIVRRLMNGELPGLPKVSFGVVDVRDIAELHLLAMTKPEAAGERFLGVSPPSLTIKGIAEALKKELPDKSGKVPTREVPNFAIKLVALYDKEAKLIVPELGKQKQMSNKKAVDMLGWKARPASESIRDTALSLMKHGLIKA